MSDEAETAEKAKPKGKRRMVLLAVPALLLLAGGGAYATGLLPGFGHGGKDAHSAGHADSNAPGPPVFFELPDLVANLNVGNRRATFIKLRSRLELARPEDIALVQAALPRLQDMFQTFLREMRPEELRNSAGTYRLREELIARASLAVPGASVRDVLFTELLVQ